MSRLIRLLSAETALRTFGRMRASRHLRSCREHSAAPVQTAVPVDIPRLGLAALMPKKRTAAVRPALVVVPVTRPATVRVYRRRSGTTMVGKIDAICRMIDRAIADEGLA